MLSLAQDITLREAAAACLLQHVRAQAVATVCMSLTVRPRSGKSQYDSENLSGCTNQLTHASHGKEYVCSRTTMCVNGFHSIYLA